MGKADHLMFISVRFFEHHKLNKSNVSTLYYCSELLDCEEQLGGEVGTEGIHSDGQGQEQCLWYCQASQLPHCLESISEEKYLSTLCNLLI